LPNPSRAQPGIRPGSASRFAGKYFGTALAVALATGQRAIRHADLAVHGKKQGGLFMKQRTSGGLVAALALLVWIGLLAGCERRPASPAPATTAEQGNKTAPAAISPEDAAVTARVKAALAAEPALKSIEIQVDTVNAVVTLSGTIDTPHNLERATQVAKAVDGVKAVSNQLNVKAPV
jgi:hyperosmotically inducible periplasmic protein